MTPRDPQPADEPDLVRSLRRLEESADFLARDLERTAREMKELWDRLAALERRVARLEQPPEPGEDEPDAIE